MEVQFVFLLILLVTTLVWLGFMGASGLSISFRGKSGRPWGVKGNSFESGKSLSEEKKNFSAGTPLTQNYFPPLSLIIAAHNEAENLTRNLPFWLNQNYPNFELIIALDRCEDDSLATIREIGARPEYQKIQICTISIEEVPADWSPKKYALKQAIESATYPVLVFTDADCQAGPNWLARMAAFFDRSVNEIQGNKSKVELVLGLSPLGLKSSAPGLAISDQPANFSSGVNIFSRWETFYTAFQYSGFSLAGFPFMAVGRNLAYTKAFYDRCGGLDTISGRLSGDDDLLVNQNAKPASTRVALDPGSYTFSDTKSTWKAWARQKQRHISAAGAYTLRSKLILALFHGAHTIFYLSLPFALWAGPAWEVGMTIFAVRWCLAMIFMAILAKKWAETRLLLLFPLLDFGYFLYNLIIGPPGWLKKPKW